MKKGRLFLPAIILASAVVITAVAVLIAGISLKPIIKESEFPFSITYEVDGETITINDVYKARYDYDEAYKYRMYVGEIQNKKEDNTYYLIKREGDCRIELWTHFYADYLMGDPEYDYFDEEPFEPRFYYYDAQETEYHDEATLAKHGVKLVSFEYPEPIKNSLRFSHIVMPEAEVVFPSIIIAFLAMLATLIFVKKDKDYARKLINIFTIVFNFHIGLFVFPFFTLFAGLLNALGDIGSVMNLITYLLPALTILGITASIGLRRKLYGKCALAVQFISPAVFVIIIIISSCLSLM